MNYKQSSSKLFLKGHRPKLKAVFGLCFTYGQDDGAQVEEDNEEADNPLNSENEPNSQNKKFKSENMCWNRGNWLSFMANIVAQIDYLGALHLLW